MRKLILLQQPNHCKVFNYHLTNRPYPQKDRAIRRIANPENL